MKKNSFNANNSKVPTKPDAFLKKEADRLMKIKGNGRGATLLSDIAYIHEKKGEGGVKAIEEKLKELGYPLRFKDIKTMGWYPEALSVLVYLIAKELFNWTEKDIFKMGNSVPKYSFIVRLLFRYFLSAKKTFDLASTAWSRHLDFGRMEGVEFNEKEKYFILRVYDYKFHPIMCTYHKGYFFRLAQYVLPATTVEETKCVFRGDPCHEYLIRWK